MTDAKIQAERKRLGEKLKKARNYLGLKQDEVANYLKIPRTALTEIETGKRKVDAIELGRLAKLYRQSVAFFTGEDTKYTDLPPDIAHLARKVADLSPNDREELNQFADFLRSRTKNPGDKE